MMSLSTTITNGETHWRRPATDEQNANESPSEVSTCEKFTAVNGPEHCAVVLGRYQNENIMVNGSCIWVIFSSSPQFVNCQISSKYIPDGALVGIGYKAKGTFEKCKLNGKSCDSSVLLVYGEGIGIVNNSTILEAECEAVYVSTKGTVFFENTLFESNQCGVLCEENGTAKIVNCMFKGNQFGLGALSNSFVECKDSHFSNSSTTGIFIKDKASGTFEKNKINDGFLGILVRSEEPLVFRSNTLKNNSSGNWSIQCSGKRLVRTDNDPNE